MRINRSFRRGAIHSHRGKGNLVSFLYFLALLALLCGVAFTDHPYLFLGMIAGLVVVYAVHVCLRYSSLD
jgi:hypothetical protein